MGCLCCRDREKPDDLDGQQLPLAVHATSHGETANDSQLTAGTVTSAKPRKQADSQSSAQGSTPSNRKKTSKASSKLEKKADPREAEAQESTDNLRSVPGGAATDYQLEEVHLGTLIQAQHRTTRQKCWVQTYELKRNESDEAVKQQLKLMKSLDHPNVLKMLDLFQDEGHFYAVFEGTEGGNAEELAARLGGVSEKWGALLMAQVFQAIGYCHTQSITLKTLSAKHVLFEKPPTEDSAAVKLLVPVGEEDQESACMAPEFKAKTHMGSANDLWNSGVLLSTLLAGECVFTKMQASFTSQEFRSAYKKWQEVSKEAKSFTLSLIARDINKRPPVEKCLQHPWMSR